MSAQATPTNKVLSQLAKEVIVLFSDTFGIDLEDLSLDTDLLEDFDIKSDLEGLARFLHAINTKYEVQISLGSIVQDLDEQTISTLSDLVTIVEEALLE